MALTLSADVSRSIELEDYIEAISKIDVTDQDAVIETAPLLRSLANNRVFLVEKLNIELGRWRNFQEGNSYSSQTLELGVGTGFYVRANIWLPPSESTKAAEWERKLQSFYQPHDHNFSFMTVGYLGSGYHTVLYEYENANVIGYVGETVDIAYRGATTLPQGKLMFYRANRDIHTQEPPDEMSVSINLLVPATKYRMRQQFEFDIENSCISRVLQNPTAAGRVAICKLAGMIGNDTTKSLLSAVAADFPIAPIRIAARQAMASGASSEAAEIWRAGLKDSDPLVRHFARTSLQALDG